MKPRSLSRLALPALLVLFAFGSTTTSCSRQAEGERCDFAANEHSDCDEGLYCVPCSLLADHVVDRCCPPGNVSNDPRCTPSKTERACQQGSGGTGGTGDGGMDPAGAGGA